MSLEWIVSFALTLLVFSYLLGDNLLYRLALYVLVGVASAFTAIVTIERIILPLLNGDALNAVLVIGGAGLSALLLLKPLPLFAPLSNLAFGFLVAVGTAVALIGAISGTLIPLIQATAYVPQTGILEAVVGFVGVVSALFYFQYTARRTSKDGLARPMRGRMSGAVARVGELFIAITLGAVYAGAMLSSLTVLIGHFSRLVTGG